MSADEQAPEPQPRVDITEMIWTVNHWAIRVGNLETAKAAIGEDHEPELRKEHRRHAHVLKKAADFLNEIDLYRDVIKPVLLRAKEGKQRRGR